MQNFELIEMAAILNFKNHICNFSPNLYWLFQRSLVVTLLGVRRTLCWNLTSKQPRPWEMAAILKVRIAFLHFFWAPNGHETVFYGL